MCLLFVIIINETLVFTSVGSPSAREKSVFPSGSLRMSNHSETGNCAWPNSFCDISFSVWIGFEWVFYRLSPGQGILSSGYMCDGSGGPGVSFHLSKEPWTGLFIWATPLPSCSLLAALVILDPDWASQVLCDGSPPFVEHLLNIIFSQVPLHPSPLCFINHVT